MRWPLTLEELERAEPVYEVFPGWSEDISGARTMADLPPAAVSYVEAVESLAGAPVAVVSVGPERTQTIMRRDLRPRPRVSA